MKVKDLIRVLSTIENQDAEVFIYNGDHENSFQNVDFVTFQSETVILNDQYNSRKFTKEKEIIPITNIILTENNVQETIRDGIKILKLKNINPLDLGFLQLGELEIRVIDDSICIINKSKDNNYYESKYAYCIFNKKSLKFITSLKEV